MKLPCDHYRYDNHGKCRGGRMVKLDRIAAAEALGDHLDWSDTEEAGWAFVSASLDVIVAAVLDAAIGDGE